ncbi:MULTISPECIES: DUF7546 family protein [Halolamina]|uniref:Uncharacterized protein n=1 Tax=Halolamina pelagica TaxID=699431 RepID=A0A1I5NH76_9EURY|nr:MULTISPECIES: hypothetical protein [Halolamina]NHX36311.1 hypothetical protein [Halolamina sp. R1-12]SFP21114.1 hypothetical protein SAMN05216277_10223 [Halolamina pelagica]
MTRTVSAPAWSVPAPLRTAVLALGVQSALALAYLGLTDAGLTAPTMLAVPFVWVTVAVVAVRHADRPRVGRVSRWIAGGIGAAYALGLGWLTGAVGAAANAGTSADLLLLPPGWGPLFRYSGSQVALTLIPYRLVGIVALGYLVSLALRDVVDEGLSVGVGGVVALGSCASCALPLVASAAGALGGAGLGVGAAPTVGGGTYLLGTAAFVLAAWVLAARPLRRYTWR